MVRRDGKAYRMTQHVYGSLSHLTEASYAAEWLYKHTMVSETKHLCQEFLDTITDETDTSLKKQFLERLTRAINTEFMRVRFGGLYETEFGCQDFYFRIASNDFNWFPIIMEFLDTTDIAYEEAFILFDDELVEDEIHVILRQYRKEPMWKRDSDEV